MPQDLFREWDSDGDGVVSLNEFMRAMPMLGIHAPRSEIQELFSSLDHDEDGVIAFKEFNRLLRRALDEQNKEDSLDEFGRVVDSDWRPKSPPIAVVDVGNLRSNVRTEHRLRGLDKIDLGPPRTGSPSGQRSASAIGPPR